MDIDPDAVDSYRRNFTGTPYEAAELENLMPTHCCNAPNLIEVNLTSCLVAHPAKDLAARA